MTKAQAPIACEPARTCDRPGGDVHNVPVAPESGEIVRFPIGYAANSCLHERQSAHSGESLAWLGGLQLQRSELYWYDDSSGANQ